MNETAKGNHGIILENRSKMAVSGVIDVISFDDQTVILSTELGELTVKGDNLKVQSFATETKNLSIEGTVYALAYTGTKKKSVVGRLFS
jgi:sporulation protein YabP